MRRKIPFVQAGSTAMQSFGLLLCLLTLCAVEPSRRWNIYTGKVPIRMPSTSSCHRRACDLTSPPDENLAYAVVKVDSKGRIFLSQGTIFYSPLQKEYGTDYDYEVGFPLNESRDWLQGSRKLDLPGPGLVINGGENQLLEWCRYIFKGKQERRCWIIADEDAPFSSIQKALDTFSQIHINKFRISRLLDWSIPCNQ